MPTIKDIAQLAGVSRGTVDRVLNKRGAVSPTTAAKIMEIANAVNYSPNLAGKTLALAKKNLKLGYILHSNAQSNMFFRDLVKGIENRAKMFKAYNVSIEIRYSRIDDPQLQVRQIKELFALGINGLAIAPINHKDVAAALLALAKNGVPVITANSDILGCGRLAYVGSNDYRTGASAAGILNLACNGKANVGVILGSHLVAGHQARVKGFTACAAKKSKTIKIASVATNNDNDNDSYTITQNMLKKHRDIDALYLAAAGVQGVCRAVEELQLLGKIKIVSTDTTPEVKHFLASGAICASIGQQPYIQGTKPLDILLDLLGMGIEPDKEFYYTSTEIYIAENI